MGPYSQAVEAGGALYVSGQLPIDAASGKMDEGIEAQTRRSLTNLGHILREAGYDYSDVVKTTVLLQSIGDFAAMNAVYAEFFIGFGAQDFNFRLYCNHNFPLSIISW